jgi:molybdopterin converting factor small subunit
MMIRVRFGSQLHVASQSHRRLVEIATDATVSTLVAQLVREEPALASALATSLAVVRGRAVSSDERLVEGEEVTFVPPAAGG